MISDGGFVRFPTELVQQHAGVVEEVAQAVQTARGAATEVTMDVLAYGLLCQFLPTLLDPVFLLAAGAMSVSVEALQETATNLRGAAADATATDVRSAEVLRAVGGGGEPRMALPL